MSERSEAQDEQPSTRSSFRGDSRGGSFLDDFVSSVFAVLGIGVLLFAISGVWPPMVAIESPSMEPNIDTGDLVFVMEENRFASEYQRGETGVATAYATQDTNYRKFNLPGDVIVYAPDGDRQATPVIHRVVFWVNETEDWSSKAQPRFVPGDNINCSTMTNCPAPNDGFITLGDNNGQYDQVRGGGEALSKPVKPEWVIGTAEFRMPIIGRLRLGVGSIAPTPTVEASKVAVS